MSFLRSERYAFDPGRQPVPNEMCQDDTSRMDGNLDNYSAFDTRSCFESFCRMLERNVSIVVRPYDSVNVSRHRNKESRIREFFYGPFDDFANVDISDLQELLFNYRWLQGKLQ